MAVEVCDVETSRTSLAGPNAPSTSPWRSVFVQHGWPPKYRWRRALRETMVKVAYRVISYLRRYDLIQDGTLPKLN